MIRSAFAFSFLLAGASLTAQEALPDSLNWVENGSFEVLDGKVKRLGYFEVAKGWKSPTAKKADLFTETVTGSPISVPRNDRGDQGALNGQNYAGLMWWSYQNKEPRTYMQAKLKKMLKKDQKYCVRYYTTLSDLSKYAADQHGAYFSKVLVKKDDESNLTYTPQVPTLRTRIYDDLYSWQGVCGVYEAKGDEQYLLIGNMTAQEKTNTTKVKRPRGETRVQANNAYYFIDDVAVFPIKLMSECKCEQLDKAASEFIFGRKGTTNKSLKPAQQVDAAVIYYKRFNKQIDGSMDAQVNELIELLKANADIRIRLVGHTDAIEADRVRMRPDLTDLDKERADGLKAAMVEAGIDAARITVAGQKADSPADGGDDDLALSKNRRVEVEIEQ
ncbi:MAG: OmpA family protein [Flavobacteriales bacterium]|nr:OmpA family protein [Flavobacteriales bacterium]